MKFISKSSNLLIVLRPGLSAQPITGTPAKPTISVRFKDGVAEVTNQELIDMMLAHPGFNGDFISAEGAPLDPYAGTRQPSEPAHILTELKHGTPMSRQVKGGNPQLPPELQKLVQSMAVDMAKQMVPEMLKSLVSQHEAGKKTTKGTKVKGKPGPKPKKKVTVDVEVPEPVVQNPPESTNPLSQESVS